MESNGGMRCERSRDFTWHRGCRKWSSMEGLGGEVMRLGITIMLGTSSRDGWRRGIRIGGITLAQCSGRRSMLRKGLWGGTGYAVGWYSEDGCRDGGVVCDDDGTDVMMQKKEGNRDWIGPAASAACVYWCFRDQGLTSALK